jgi:hypothetical protein
MLEPRRLTTLWASTACYRDSFYYIVFTRRIQVNNMKYFSTWKTYCTRTWCDWNGTIALANEDRRVWGIARIAVCKENRNAWRGICQRTKLSTTNPWNWALDLRSAKSVTNCPSYDMALIYLKLDIPHTVHLPHLTHFNGQPWKFLCLFNFLFLLFCWK